MNKNKLKYIKFKVLNLNRDKFWRENTKSYETVLVVLSGKCKIEIDNKNFGVIGKRKDVFSGKAYGLYIPINSAYKIKAVTKVEIAICKALAHKKFTAGIIEPKDVKVRVVGKGNWKRRVYDIVDKNVSAHRILVGETMNPPGNWSSSPPHKHDVENLPVESKQEELYLFKVSPKQGFGIQRIYSPKHNLDKTYVLFDNTNCANFLWISSLLLQLRDINFIICGY